MAKICMIMTFQISFQQLLAQQASLEQVRYRSRLPVNTVILFVPQQEAWVVERFGKFHRILDPVSNVIL